MTIDRKEVLRYMLWRKGEPDDVLLSLIERICGEFEKNVTPKSTYRKVSVSVRNNTVTVDDTDFESKSLSKHLENAKEGIIISATLGVEADNIIRREMVLGTLNASVAQAVATAMIEDYLDSVCKGLERQYSVSFLPRFSPGYGDWALNEQTKILNLSGGYKQCGITLTESYMMLPTKSVTAIVGITDRCKNEMSSCENCNKKDCEFRK